MLFRSIADVDVALRRVSTEASPEPVVETATTATPDSNAPVQLELNFDNPDKDI